MLEERFTGLAGVERAMIYGSWARRYHGDPGPLPQDVDVLVIGTGEVDQIRTSADSATRKLGRDVNVTVLTAAEWDSPESGFIEHVKNGPLVDLDLRR